MKSFAKLSFIPVLFFMTTGFLSAQRYVNQEWSSITGLPINIHWSASMIASTGHIVTVGNTYTSGQSTNVLLTKYATDGSIVWQVEYDNPDNLEDYGIALCEDDSGNFYVAGTSYRSSSSSLELTVLKFNSGGTNQWAYFFDGSASGDDIPAGIATDGINVYVAGGTESVSSATDFVTIKLKHDGTSLWTEYYDHNSLADVAVDIDINQSGHVIVSGGSADQANVYDMATIKYDSYGNTVNEHRSNYNVGIDQPTCFDMDGNGNTVIGGNYIPSQGQMQISVISLNDTLGLNWSLLHDPAAGEDNIVALTTDASGNIYVTGHTEESPGYFKCYTAKIDNNGNVQWERAYQSPSGGAFGKAIRLTPTGDVIVAGMNYDASGDTNIIVLTYATNGRPLSSKEYDAGGAEIASSLEADNWGSIYVHGTSTSNANGYVTLKYSSFDRPFNAMSDTAFNVDYVDDEIIVQFKPSATKTNSFSDRGKTFGLLLDFITSSAINELNEKFESNYAWSRFNAVKVFRNMTPADSLSITRTGDTVRMHHFWTTLVVQIPSSLSEFSTSDSLNTLKSIVYNCEPNLIGGVLDLPDDSVFVAGSQDGLESSNTPENDIEMDRAWDIYKGTNHSRVGIFDSGIDFDHEDLSKTGQLTYQDSKIAGGFDYWNNSPVPSGNGDDHGHGTRTAGVVGAIRDNGIGVASVSGGDASNNNYGCELVDFRIFDENAGFGGLQTAIDKAAEAMVEGSRDWNGGGFALSVLNHSWRINPSSSLNNMSNKSLMFKTNQSVYNNDAVNVCGRGNENNMNEVIPASAGPDHFMISVGGSGGDGKKSLTSSFGGDIDIIAPGVASLVYSTDAYWGSIQQKYHAYDGTSAAVPHVSGVAALLTGQATDPNLWVPNKLAPDDVENLIQLYPTDVSSPNYDDSTGWGRLNAGLLMEHMEWPYYWVQHYNTVAGEVLSSFVDDSIMLVIKEDFDYPGTANDVAEGTYHGKVYKTTYNTVHSTGGAQVLNAWIRNGAAVSNLLAYNPDSIYNIPFATLDSFNQNQAFITGYRYLITHDEVGNPVTNRWLPPDTAMDMIAWSVHLYDPEATGVDENQEELLSPEGFQVFPNPSGDYQTVIVPEGESVSVGLFDMHGRQMKSVYEGNISDSKRMQVNIKDLSAGIYFYRYSSIENSYTIKIIKQ